MERIKFVIKNLWTTTKYDCLPEKSQKSWRKIIGFSSDANRRRNITCDLKIMKFCSVAIFPVIVYTTSNFQSSSESTCEKLSMWRTLDFDLRYFWKVVLFTFYILRLHNHSILDQDLRFFIQFWKHFMCHLNDITKCRRVFMKLCLTVSKIPLRIMKAYPAFRKYLYIASRCTYLKVLREKYFKSHLHNCKALRTSRLGYLLFAYSNQISLHKLTPPSDIIWKSVYSKTKFSEKEKTNKQSKLLKVRKIMFGKVAWCCVFAFYVI